MQRGNGRLCRRFPSIESVDILMFIEVNVGLDQPVDVSSQLIDFPDPGTPRLKASGQEFESFNGDRISIVMKAFGCGP